MLTVLDQMTYEESKHRFEVTKLTKNREEYHKTS
jgi:hypothetical protein